MKPRIMTRIMTRGRCWSCGSDSGPFAELPMPDGHEAEALCARCLRGALERVTLAAASCQHPEWKDPAPRARSGPSSGGLNDSHVGLECARCGYYFHAMVEGSGPGWVMFDADMPWGPRLREVLDALFKERYDAWKARNCCEKCGAQKPDAERWRGTSIRAGDVNALWQGERVAGILGKVIEPPPYLLSRVRVSGDEP